jgi:hypothetical protein
MVALPSTSHPMFRPLASVIVMKPDQFGFSGDRVGRAAAHGYGNGGKRQ